MVRRIGKDMKTKWIWIMIATIGLGFAALGVTGCKKSTEQSGSSQKYTCTMHPEVLQDAPGKCPKCDMALVAK